MTMRGGTLFSGIKAPEQAMPWVDWRWCADIDPVANAIGAARHPCLNLGDVSKVDPDAIEPVDLLVFGSPCQSFSIAGKRLGLDDPRGNLALVALRLAECIRPRWLVFENVPGLLSSDGGADFQAFLVLLGQCGYGWAYRVLDAQYFGVPQRRRRIFLVGHFGGDWRRAAAVLFEPESLRGDPAPRRETREEVAGRLGGGTGSRGWCNDLDRSGAFIRCTPDSITGTVTSKWAKGTGGPAGDEHYNLITSPCAPPLTSNPYGDHESREGLLVTHTLRTEGFDASEDGTGRGVPLVTAFDCKASGRNGFGEGEITPTLRAMNSAKRHNNGGGQLAVMQPYTLAIRGRDGEHQLEYRQDGVANAILTPNGGRGGIGVGAIAVSDAPTPKHQTDVAFTLTTPSPSGGGHPQAVLGGSSVRRLTPTECERLQGFPDGYTAITYRGKPLADGPRYKALGNSMAVPVVRWIGDRLRIASEVTI